MRWLIPLMFLVACSGAKQGSQAATPAQTATAHHDLDGDGVDDNEQIPGTPQQDQCVAARSCESCLTSACTWDTQAKSCNVACSAEVTDCKKLPREQRSLEIARVECGQNQGVTPASPAPSPQ